jgi:hypothetical protein
MLIVQYLLASLALPADSPYHKTVRVSLTGTLVELWHETGTPAAEESTLALRTAKPR